MKKYLIPILTLVIATCSFSSFSFAQAQTQYGEEAYFGSSQNTQSVTSGASNSNTPSNSGGGERVRDLGSLVNFLMKYMNTFMYLVISFGVVVFVYNVIMFYVVKTDDDRKDAKQYVLYSVVGLFIIVSFWGLVNFVSKTLDLDNSKPNIQNLYFK